MKPVEIGEVFRGKARIGLIHRSYHRTRELLEPIAKLFEVLGHPSMVQRHNRVRKISVPATVVHSNDPVFLVEVPEFLFPGNQGGTTTNDNTGTTIIPFLRVKNA
jgi:hypothetical protein